MESDGRRLKCCDPFKRHKGIIRSGLRRVNLAELPLSLKIGVLTKDDYWCDNCRKKACAEKSSEDHQDDTLGVAEGSEHIHRSPKQEDGKDEKEGEEPTKSTEGDEIVCLESSQCSFAERCAGTPCSAGTFTILSSLPKSDSLALSWSSGLWILPPDASVCDTHFENILGCCIRKESVTSHKCCDPFKRHKHSVKSGLRVISTLAAIKAREKKVELFAGDFLCDLCRKDIDNIPLSDSQVSSKEEEIVLSGVSSHVIGLSQDVIREELQHNIQALDLSPVEMSASSSKTGRVQYAKRKLETVSNVIRKKLCIALDLEEKEVLSEETALALARVDLNTLCSEIKEKLKDVNSKTQLQYLTLCPPSWTSNYAANYFGVSRYMIEKARHLKSESGILSVPSYPTLGVHLSEQSKKLVIDYYCDDENSRILPGKKDFVSIGRGQHKQKRLILSTLRELFTEFKKKEEHKDVKIGFSLFCSLRPKWCVLAGASGTHNVCVCTIHQNTKLMLNVLQIHEPLTELIKNFVCSLEKRECMLSLCSKCPSTDSIAKTIQSQFLEKRPCPVVTQSGGESDTINEFDFLEEKVEYKEWTSTDRAELVTRVCKVSELIDIVAAKIKKLIPHHFVSKQQSEFLRKSKDSLSENQAIILMDFSMNYTCLVQDAAQSYHWAKKGVTLHPTVIYVKATDGTIIHKSICFISDDIVHDVSMVKIFQSQTISFIKENFPAVNQVMFMTDGCAAQYKNCSSFLHLTKFEELFNVKATWCFCATSHGKCACDGIGGLVKREATKASLRRPLKDQILDAQSLFDFCQENLSNTISYFLVKKREVDAQRLLDKEDRNRPVTIPGTRMFHHFVPLSGTVIGCKRVSTDKEYDLVHDLCPSPTEEQLQLELNLFVAVMINSDVYIGLIMDINYTEKEVDLTLLEPPLPSSIFLWPDIDINCYVAPIPHILCIVKMQEVDNLRFQIPTNDILRIRQLASRARASREKATMAGKKRKK